MKTCATTNRSAFGQTHVILRFCSQQVEGRESIGNACWLRAVHYLKVEVVRTPSFPLMTQTVSLAFVTTAIAASLGEGWFAFHHENVLGTSLELKVVARTQAAG